MASMRIPEQQEVRKGLKGVPSVIYPEDSSICGDCLLRYRSAQMRSRADDLHSRNICIVDGAGKFFD